MRSNTRGTPAPQVGDIYSALPFAAAATMSEGWAFATLWHACCKGASNSSYNDPGLVKSYLVTTLLSLPIPNALEVAG